MAEGDVELGPVDIDGTVQLLLNFDEVQNRSKHHSGSIYMVPSVYRDISPTSFTPRVVSIGPLHHEDKHLKGFEVQKATYLHNLLHNLLSSLGYTPEQILKECVTKVTDSLNQIKACYIGIKTSDSKLVKLMVTDACFILAFIYNRKFRYCSLGQNNSLFAQIYHDMVLIENQIPFFVLKDIFECTFKKLHPAYCLAEYIFCILNYCNIFQDSVIHESNISETHDHILGILHKSYQNPYRRSSRLYGRYPKAHSAVELDRSGVRFSKKLHAKWPMAMELKFSRFLCFPLNLAWSKPTLKMPVPHLVDGTELIIRNLIIYEQFAEVQTCVTSYMLALDKLIDTPEDVVKLVKSQVIVNRLGSVEKATNLINNMLEQVIIKEFFYQDEWRLLDQYYNAKWPKFIAVLRRNYFSNPWSIIALIAGIAGNNWGTHTMGTPMPQSTNNNHDAPNPYVQYGAPQAPPPPPLLCRIIWIMYDYAVIGLVKSGQSVTGSA
ncbi:hypothetical protein CTI12_AA021170 [Artemisia annua]|uniref:Uncharacterized protein n=1 Tax=Artemisia annua TaxID=35608 RepID=A0A2U1QJX9_ARTAN|nr:hypothetical protein CTI12_AA021170 [Artemisia annua]